MTLMLSRLCSFFPFRPKRFLRPFDRSDWMAFSGCETANPLIGEADQGAVILDGTVVQFFTAIDGIPVDTAYRREFESVSEARMVAETILTTSNSEILAKVALERII